MRQSTIEQLKNGKIHNREMIFRICPLFAMLSLFTNSGELQIFCCCVFSLPLSFPCPTFVTPVPAIVHIAHGGGSPPPQITREPQFGLSGKCKKAPRMRHKSGRQLPIPSWQQFMAENCGWLVGHPRPRVSTSRDSPNSRIPNPDPELNSGIRIHPSVKITSPLQQNFLS